MSNNDMTIRSSSFNKIVIIAVVASMISSFFGGYILRGAVGGANSQNSNSQPASVLQQPQVPPAVPVRISSVSFDNAPLRGSPDAPLTMVEFTDFQCPFCGSFFSQTEPQIQKNYIDPGKVKFVHKDFPLDNLHPNAREAANAARCANEQGAFWLYHDTLFLNQTQWANLDAPGAANTFKKYASDLKLKASTFNSCLDSKKYSSVIDKDSQEGSKDGVSGTPTFYIGNNKTGYTQLVGAQPYQTFQQSLDQQLLLQQQRR